MATTETTGPQQPITDAEARMRAFQIIGSDITPDLESDVWTGNWHKALQTAAARWTPTDQPTTDNTPAA